MASITRTKERTKTPLASLRMVDCMSISNDVPLDAINHSQLMRGIVHKYWVGIRKYVGVLGPKERRASTSRVAPEEPGRWSARTG